MDIDPNTTTEMDSDARKRNQYFQPGDIVADRYEFVCWLGQGGMGKVCLCKDTKDNGREVALKMVPDILKGNAAAEEALRTEYRKMLQLTHDGIVPVRNLENDEFRFYVVMDYVRGETLESYLKSHPKPGLHIMQEVVRRLAVALDYAHGKNMVHRDVKPANVMVDIDGENVKSVKLLDFGLSLQIRESVSRVSGIMSNGTPAYKSPEQWRPDLYNYQLTAKTDMYSLGAVAYEMLGGNYPFSMFDMETFPNAVLNVPPAIIDGLSSYVNGALQKALSKKPSDRFANCKEFADALSVSPRPVIEEKPSLQPSVIKTSPFTQKNMTLMLSGKVPMELIYIRAGSFMMGSPAREQDRCNNETFHRVILTKDFWLGKFEVTQKQYQAIMGLNQSFFNNDDSYPAEQVSWIDAMDFCRRITEQERLAGRLPSEYEYILPTEAQWEYACRAGTMTPFSFGTTCNGDKANYNGYPYVEKRIYLESTTAVGCYAPNAWGLFDMHGNVWEWCCDSCNSKYNCVDTDTYQDDIMDPLCNNGSYRVIRGGSWKSNAQFCRSACRGYREPTFRDYDCGFRVALTSVQ